MLPHAPSVNARTVNTVAGSFDVITYWNALDNPDRNNEEVSKFSPRGTGITKAACVPNRPR